MFKASLFALFALFALAFVLAILPFAAQGRGRPIADDVYDDVLVQNLCISEINDSHKAAASMAFDDRQLAKLRIELLERGFDPGFDVEAVDADAKLAEAIRMFQAEFSLPITGRADPATLFMLGVPLETNDSAVWQLSDAFMMGRRVLHVACRPGFEATSAQR